MFEKIGQSAENLVSKANVSRRGFLGTAAKGAAAVAGLLGGLLLFPQDAEARRYRRSASSLCRDCLVSCRASGYSERNCKNHYCYFVCL
jgi:anaerobic selenocysteine-containing dehydrogenase